MHRQALREAILIFLAASVAGFSYTAITKRGMFGEPASDATSSLSSKHGVPKMVKLEDARKLFDGGDAVFIDSRHEFDYRLGHIRGSVNIPLAGFDQKLTFLANIPKEKTLVVYCDGAECNSSFDLSGKLFDAGYRNINIFFGGWQDWISHGLPTEKSSK